MEMARDWAFSATSYFDLKKINRMPGSPGLAETFLAMGQRGSEDAVSGSTTKILTVGTPPECRDTNTDARWTRLSGSTLKENIDQVEGRWSEPRTGVSIGRTKTDTICGLLGKVHPPRGADQ